ncbi:MAG: hypothetical protein WAK56_03560 [Candidatus Sulfotelmatobacter sp.]
MNKADSDKIHDLCSRIAVEHDHKKFLALVEELNRILSAQDKSFDKSAPKQNNE